MTGSAIFHSETKDPTPTEFNLAAYVLSHADKTPEKTALECLASPGVLLQSFTYAELHHAVSATAGGLLALGLRPNQYLILRLGNHPRFPILFLAACSVGIIPVITPAAWTQAEFAKACALIDPIAAIARDDGQLSGTIRTLDPDTIDALVGHAPALVAATQADDPAYIVFTSGSSGDPKPVLHAHRAVWARRMMRRDWSALNAKDRLLHAGAFNWTYTLGTGLLDPWAIGATALIYTGKQNPRVWPDLLAQHKATLFAAAPGVFRQCLKSDDLKPLPKLRHALSAGEGLPKPVAKAWHKATGTRIYGALGMSECSTYISSSPDHPSPRPQTGRHIAVLNENGAPARFDETGDLAIHRSDPGLTLGYLTKTGAIELPLRGDWFITGDRAAMAKEGTISHAGRADDLITAGGYRIAPQEIEAALLGHGAITDCAAVGLTTKSHATIVAAFFVSAETIDQNTLNTYMATHLARYKVPRAFIQLAALPTSANGKLDRKALSQWTLPT